MILIALAAAATAAAQPASTPAEPESHHHHHHHAATETPTEAAAPTPAPTPSAPAAPAPASPAAAPTAPVPAPAPGRQDLSTAKAAAFAFYGAYIGTTAGAFPGPRARFVLRPLLSPRLNMLLEQAAWAMAYQARASRGQAAPAIEGDVFTSMFEGAGRFQVERCRIGSVRAICSIWLGYEGSGPPARWRDQLVLMRGPRGWVVDDVIYGGSWSFGNRGRLSQTLRGAVSGG